MVHKKSAWSIGDDLVLNICREEELFLEDRFKRRKRPEICDQKEGWRQKDERRWQGRRG